MTKLLDSVKLVKAVFIEIKRRVPEDRPDLIAFFEVVLAIVIVGEELFGGSNCLLPSAALRQE
jgi:hypothetical protein